MPCLLKSPIPTISAWGFHSAYNSAMQRQEIGSLFYIKAQGLSCKVSQKESDLPTFRIDRDSTVYAVSHFVWRQSPFMQAFTSLNLQISVETLQILGMALSVQENCKYFQ